jgi:hypothetical protein
MQAIKIEQSKLQAREGIQVNKEQHQHKINEEA